MAANAGAIKAGKAFVEFSLSDKKLMGQLRALKKRLMGIGSGLQRLGRIGIAVGGAISAAFAGAAKTFAATGDQLDKMRHRTGVSVEALSGLMFAASQTGTSAETVEKGFAGLSRTFFEAKRGSAVAVDALKEIGLTFQDLQGLSPDKQFELIADGIAKISDESIKGAVAQNIFGRAGRQLLPLMKLGSQGIQAYRKEAEALGITLTDADAKSAADLTDALDRLWRQVKAVVVQIGAAVAGPLTDFLALTKPILRAVIDWVKNNWPLIRTIAAIGLAVGAVGGVLLSAGIGFSVLGMAAGGLASAIGVVGTVLGALVSPIGLVVAGLAGGTAAFLAFTDTGNGMVQGLVDGFAWLKDTVLVSVKAISAALSAGDIEAAGKVLWATLKLLWLQGTQFIREAWHTLTGGIVKGWYTAWAGVLQLGNYVWSSIVSSINSVWGNIERGVSHVSEWMLNGFTRAGAGIKKIWNSTLAFFKRTWQRIKGLFGADVQGEIDRINAELEIANREIDRKTKQTTSQRSAAAEAAREQSRRTQQGASDVISSQYQERLDQIGADLAAKLSGANNGTRERIAAAQQQLEDARAAWKDATAAAEAAGEAAKQQTVAAQQTGNALAGAATNAVKASSRGTFNGVNLLALQSVAGGPEEQTAKNTAKIAELQEETLRAFSLLSVPKF